MRQRRRDRSSARKRQPSAQLGGGTGSAGEPQEGGRKDRKQRPTCHTGTRTAPETPPVNFSRVTVQGSVEIGVQEFSKGDFVGAVAETLTAESLTRVLYPDDSTSLGQRLRFVQEYFLAACSLADLVRRYRRGNHDWASFPGKVAIQLNDTHPTKAGPELMRILLDGVHLRWGEAWG